jgi:hypothetical protein
MRWLLALVGVLTSTLSADELCLTGNARGNRGLRMAFAIHPEAARCIGLDP